MQLTLYPNQELRARITASPLRGRRRLSSDRKMVAAPILSIVENLRQKCPAAFKPLPDPALGRVGYGVSPRLREFSLYARRKIVRAGALLGRGEARARVLFLTGTLPGGTETAMRAISDYSGWVVHEVLSRLPRLWRGRLSDVRTLWVWEWQKRGALHWHAIVECPDWGVYGAVRRGFRRVWESVLIGLADRSGVDVCAKVNGGTWRDDPAVWRVEAQPARKNPSRYLAKYLSKAQPVGDWVTKYPPSCWYQVCRKLHVALRAETVHVQTSTTTGVPDHKLCENHDIELLERFFGASYQSRYFSDKIRDGQTFVFYIKEELMDEIKKTLAEYQPREMQYVVRFEHRKPPTYYGLREVEKHSWLLVRYFEDLGSYYQGLYTDWVSGNLVPEEEMFWLDHYAHQILHRQGWVYQGQPPERSAAGLPGTSDDKIGAAPAPIEEDVQPSFLP